MGTSRPTFPHLIKPFVRFVKGGNRDIDDAQFADGAVPATGPDINGSHRLNGKKLAIEFHLAFASKNEIDFGHFLVVVGARIFLDIHEMKAGSIVRGTGKGAPGPTTRAANGLSLIEMGDHEVHGWILTEKVGSVCGKKASSHGPF